MEKQFYLSSAPYQRYLRIWKPKGTPNMIILVSHGMAEHIDRYHELGVYLSQQGYLLAGLNHLGHGEEAPVLGWFAQKDGWDKLITDLKSIFDLFKKDYPQVPLVLLGHSMGSFLAREFVLRHPNILSALILSGTGWHPKGLCLAGLLPAQIICMIGLGKKPSKMLDKLAFSANNKQFCSPSGTSFDWLSRDSEQVKQYVKDPFCGFVFTGGGFRDLFAGLLALSNTNRIQKLPKDLPIYLISGDQDPVGQCGKGVKTIAQQYLDNGIKRVEVKLYDGARHELFFEINKLQVMQDLVNWLNQIQ